MGFAKGKNPDIKESAKSEVKPVVFSANLSPGWINPS
jgi:hypothetical protein